MKSLTRIGLVASLLLTSALGLAQSSSPAFADEYPGSYDSPGSVYSPSYEQHVPPASVVDDAAQAGGSVVDDGAEGVGRGLLRIIDAVKTNTSKSKN